MAEQKIYTAISGILAGLGAIGKTRKNPQQGYSFRGIDDVYNAINPLMAEHKVFCVPEIVSMDREERTTKSGGALIYTVAKMKYTLYAEDGSSVSGVTIGEAMDSGDKSSNKAMAAAQKYFILQTFCVPTDEPKDTENETHEVRPRAKAEPKPDARKARIVALVRELSPDLKTGTEYATFVKTSVQLDLVEANYDEIIGRLEVLAEENKQPKYDNQ